MQLIFGPVYSRRFGNSLGIDLSAQTKQCNFDCLYCELAPAQPVDKQQYSVSVEEIVGDVCKHLNETIDVITVTANGEPTLYPYLDELVNALAEVKKDIKLLILSNSAALCQKEIFCTLLKFDMVKLSLDAASPAVFKKIDRPHPSIDIKSIIAAIESFSAEFDGELFIETLFVKGINDTPEEINALNEVFLRLFNITRIDIGTIDRPPAYPVEGVDYHQLHRIAQSFDTALPINIVSRQKLPHNRRYNLKVDEVINTLEKRPLTREDMQALFSQETLHEVNRLIETGRIVSKKVGTLEFFLPAANMKRKRVKIS